jgi:hypothetical protein
LELEELGDRFPTVLAAIRVEIGLIEDEIANRQAGIRKPSPKKPVEIPIGIEDLDSLAELEHTQMWEQDFA